MKISLGRDFVSNADWLKKASQIRSRIDAVARFFHARRPANPDDMFFSFEELPFMGKEYWFLHFNRPGTKQQAVITFGRAEGEVKVNRTAVPKSYGRTMPLPGNAIKCAAVCWLYGRKKQIVIDSHADVSLKAGEKGNFLCAKSGRGNFACISGKYPDFKINLSKNGRIVFSAKVSAPKKGAPYEVVEMLRSPVSKGVGAVMVNYYFDFSGKLEGRKISGKAYLQKVVAVMPLAPWNWVRVQFAKDSSFDFFAAKPLGDTPAEIHFAANAFLEISGRRIKVSGNLRLESWFDGEERKWLLSGKDFYLAMETYSVQPFVMKQKTVFRYDEYLVRVTDFAMKNGGRTYTLADLGDGSGIVEDAAGYLI